MQHTVHCSLQDGAEEEVDIVNDGSQQDAETNQFDHVVGALTGMAVVMRSATMWTSGGCCLQKLGHNIFFLVS